MAGRSEHTRTQTYGRSGIYKRMGGRSTHAANLCMGGQNTCTLTHMHSKCMGGRSTHANACEHRQDDVYTHMHMQQTCTHRYVTHMHSKRMGGRI